MNKDIKLRAWDKTYKEMVNGLLCFYGCGGISHNNHFNSDTPPFRGYMWNYKNLKVMQWTGLFDRHGVEIYTDDLVKLTETGDLYRIEFYCGTFGLWVDKGLVTEAFFPLYKLSSKNLQVIEVVGNVHENLELLRGGGN